MGRLRQEVERLTALEAAEQKRGAGAAAAPRVRPARPEAAEPWAKTVVSERFLESLLAAADEQAMRALVEERARLVRTLVRRPAGAAPRRTAAAVARSAPRLRRRAVERQEFCGSDYVKRGQGSGTWGLGGLRPQDRRPEPLTPDP